MLKKDFLSILSILLVFIALWLTSNGGNDITSYFQLQIECVKWYGGG